MAPLPSLDVTIDPLITIPFLSFEGNPLAFLDILDIRRISGYASHRSIGTQNMATDSPKLSKKEKLMVCEGWFRHLLRTSGVSHLAADTGSALMTSDSLDIAEVEGCGIESLSTAAAHVVADEICLSLVRGSVNPDLRRVDKVMAVGLSKALASTFALHIGHPSLDNDPAVVKYHLYDGPTYYGHVSRPFYRITNLISNKSLEMLEGSITSYYLRRVCVFSSEHEMGVFQVFLTTFARMLLYCTRVSGLEWENVAKITGRFLIPIMRSDQSEEHKVYAVLASCKSLIPWLKGRQLYVASSYFEKLGESRVVVGMQMSAREAMRLVRIPLEDRIRTGSTRVRNPVSVSRLPPNDLGWVESTLPLTPCGPYTVLDPVRSKKESILHRM